MSIVLSSSTLLRLTAVVAVGLLGAPAAAHAGGDDDDAAPITTSPRGPWSTDAGNGARYAPSGTRRCATTGWRKTGPGLVLGLYVRGPGCRGGKRLAIAYQRCLERPRGRTGACYARVDNRCVTPEFLGRCRTYDRLYRRRVAGYACIERRLGVIRDTYDANVTCSRGRRRIDHSYTLITGDAVAVGTEAELRAAWANPRLRSIALTSDIVLRACQLGDPMRESSGPISLDGNGHTLRQGCFERRLLRQDGTGFVELKRVTLTRGGSDGPGGAVTTRGEIAVIDSKVFENLAEEPGGGIMSQRRATIIRSVITGNLANDDGGGVYARRGGIRVYDSILNNNLVDGSGGALGSTGDILVVRSHVDGNTTDGDGGAIYTDEDGDVTVIDSTVNGSTADGPGGAIFTLDGDVTVINSTLDGNRADDRGGAISGEAAVTVINSTVSRNLAVAHVGGGLWARGNLYVANSTITDNYAEGSGGGVLAAGTVTLVNSTVSDNVAPVGANVGAGAGLVAFGSVIGPAKVDGRGGDAQPTHVNCETPTAVSLGYNVVSDASCGLSGTGDLIGVQPRLLRGEGSLFPRPGSPVIDRIPLAACLTAPTTPALEGEQHLAGLVKPGLLAADQRGVPRPQGGGCDAGAIEASG